MKYLVIFEKGENSYGAYVPDLPGCVAVGESLGEVKNSIRGAVKMHLEKMRQDGDEIPEPSSESDYLDLSA